MNPAVVILALVTLQRLGELALSHHNTRRLLARGAVEAGARHYPFIVALHAAWLIALWVLGRYQSVDWIALAAFVLFQGFRGWVLVSLGPRWTTRIIFLPGERLVASGPYRYFAHPNYAVVIAEIAILPLALHLPGVALLFSALNGVVLWIRIRAEARALALTGGRSSAPVS